jgi:hypothetical protein
VTAFRLLFPTSELAVRPEQRRPKDWAKVIYLEAALAGKITVVTLFLTLSGSLLRHETEPSFCLASLDIGKWPPRSTHRPWGSRIGYTPAHRAERFLCAQSDGRRGPFSSGGSLRVFSWSFFGRRALFGGCKNGSNKGALTTASDAASGGPHMQRAVPHEDVQLGHRI